MEQNQELSKLDRAEKWGILLIGAQNGEAAAYRVLLTDLQQYVSSRLRIRLSNRNELDDITQEILIAIHKARHTYDISRPFMPWLNAIIKYKMLDALRRHKRIQSFEIQDELAFEHVLETNQPAAANEQLNEEVWKVFHALPEKQRRAVELMKFEGFTAKEASVQMGMSEAAIKVSAHRAYKSLRRRFLGDKP
ncbi:MAG: sigma-70 family RNA polymerase sigma factor [Proteobacteria bacterium]|nr:sigma-70 family RNA polymerase sigma factor [Pseudomonadota bacterium]